jgi:hypothetical protein
MKTFLAVLIVVTLALAWRLHVTNDTLVGQEQGLGQQRRTLGALATALAAPTVVVRRISATACFEQGVPGVRAEMRLGNFTPTETEGIGSRRVGNSITLYCPIPSDSMLPHANIDQVEVRGWGSSLCRPAPSTSCPPFVLAYLCVSYHNTASGTCTRFRRSEVRGANFLITFRSPRREFPDYV